MKLSEISIQRPVLASMMSLGLILFGFIGLSRLPVRELPDIDPPIVNVTTVYPGASAAVVEAQLTETLEDSLTSIEGIRKLTSESRQQVSIITIEFDLSREIEVAAQDVRDRVARVRGTLPDDIEEPIIAKQDANAQPVLWIALFSDRYSTLELTSFSENLIKDRLQTVSGVSSIIFGGEKRFAIRIWLDAQKMAARGITVLDVEQALKSQSVELPSGLVENYQRSMSIETRGELKTPEEYNKLVIKQDAATFVRLSDIGHAAVGVEDERSVARFKSKPCVGIGVVKQSKANTIEVTKGVKKELDRLLPLLPQGVEAAIAYDESIYVEHAIKEVWETLFIAFLLVVLSIYVFLHDLRSTLIPTITIPVSIIATFGILYAMGYSINIVSMLAFVLAIGLVVDDSIIVLENIYRHIENGMKPMEAAFKGMKEIGFVIIATTVALVAVFLPMAFQTSVTGRLFIEFAVALSMSVVVSAFVALTLSPMLAGRILKPVAHASKSGFLGMFERYLTTTTERYGRALRWSLHHSGKIMLLTVATILLTVFFFSQLKKEFMPEEDKGWLLVFALAPEGSTSEYTDRMIKKMEDIVSKVPEVKGYFSAVALAMGSPGQPAQGLSFIQLKEGKRRHLRDIVGGPTGLGGQFFNNIEGAFVIPIIPKSIGGGFNQPFEFIVQSQDLEGLNKYSEELTNKLRAAGFLMNVRTTFEMNKPELRINIDRDRAAAVGVTVEDISRTMQILFGGLDLVKVNIKGKEYDVIAQLERSSRLTPSDLEKIYIRNTRGELIQLNNVITYETGAGPSAIFHYNRWRSATIEGTPVGVTLGTAMEKTMAIVKEADLPEGFRYEWTGEARDLLESSGQIYFVMILAAVVIYMVLAAQFESLIHPLTVMFTIPLAAFGAFGGLWLMSLISGLGIFGVIQGMGLNLYSQIGMILLFGLVTKNAILLVDFANQQMAQGKSAREAMEQAGLIRLRPILMTAVATVMGILPIAIGFGASGEARRPLGVAAVFGMTTSTFLTLFVIPVVYVFFSNLTQKRKSKEVVISKEGIHIASIILLICFVSGCTVGPHYKTPSAVYEQSWKNTSLTNTDFIMPENWWKLFNDEELNRLEDLAKENNQDLAIAMANVDKARALARVARGELWPEAEFNPSAERARTNFGFGGESQTINSIDIPLDLSYEIDFWGRVRRAFAAGRAEAQAQSAAYGTVFITLTADVARNYFTIVAIDAEINALVKAVELRQRAVDMLKLRYEQGMNSQLTFFQAETQLSQAQADLVDARRRRENSVNVLAVLCGQNASAFLLPTGALQKTVPEIPSGIQSDILHKRPDIIEAERLLSAASERVGIAQAAFFPTVTLTGSAGFSSIDSGNIFDWENRVWSIGPSASLPLFNGGRLKAQEEAQQAEYQRSFAEYRKRILVAFSEVENALADVHLRQEQYGAQMKLVEAATQAAEMSIQRYKEGLVSFLEVIDSERSRLEAERDAIKIQSEVLISSVQLVKSLGGGWLKETVK